MAVYVDGFLLPVPKKNLDKYRRMATVASRVWKEHGALEYRECLADDVQHKGMPSFLKAVKAKPALRKAAAARKGTARKTGRAGAASKRRK